MERRSLMMKTIIRAPAAGTPGGPYSQAVMVNDWIFVCGEKGVDPASGKIVEGGVQAETSQALRNIRSILEVAGASLDDVVRCVVYMTDLGEFPAMNQAYAEFFKDRAPARTTVGVAALPLGLRVTIEATAVRGSV
jgi:2-iminobutanoate/2-iminopropanoate deaminase